MAYKVDYEFKTDKAGHKYALKIDLRTGKKKRIKYKVATKRSADLTYQREKARIIREVIEPSETGDTWKQYKKVLKQIEDTNSGGTYEEYGKVSKDIEKEIIEKRKKTGKAPYKKSTMRGVVKQKAIYERTGIATRERYMWLFRKKLVYINENTGKMYYKCVSPEFTSFKECVNGDDFTAMKKDVIDEYNEIKANNLCSLDGGACVILYNKSDKSVIDMYEIGKGCGFQFVFRDKDKNIIYKLKDGYFSDRNGRE